MAKEYAAEGIHVAHVVVDGGIAGDKIIPRTPQMLEQMGMDGLISIEGRAARGFRGDAVARETTPRAAMLAMDGQAASAREASGRRTVGVRQDGERRCVTSDTCCFLHQQPRQAWTFELDQRTFKENW